MNSRQRLIKSFNGEKTDKTPWSFQSTRTFFLGIPEYKEKFATEEIKGPIDPYLNEEELRFRVDFYQSVGADFQDWLPRAVNTKQNKLKTKVKKENNTTIITHKTPVGTLTAITSYKDEAISSHPVKYPIENFDDLDPYIYMVKDREFEPNYEEMKKRLEVIGGDGVALTIFPNSPLQNLLLGDIGIERTFYFLHDYREKMEELISAMHQKNKEFCKLLADSPARVFCDPGVTGTGMLSPELYREFVVPYTKEYVDILHKKNKIAISHASGEPLKHILDDIKETEIDAVHGMWLNQERDGKIANFIKSWDTDVTIFGGLDANFLARSSSEEVEKRVTYLLEEIKSHPAYVVGSSDDIVNGTPVENLETVSRVIQENVN